MVKMLLIRCFIPRLKKFYSKTYSFNGFSFEGNYIVGLNGLGKCGGGGGGGGWEWRIKWQKKTKKDHMTYIIATNFV